MKIYETILFVQILATTLNQIVVPRKKIAYYKTTINVDQYSKEKYKIV